MGQKYCLTHQRDRAGDGMLPWRLGRKAGPAGLPLLMEGVNQDLRDAARSGDIEKLQVAACILVQIGLSIRERKWPSLGCRVRSGWGPTQRIEAGAAVARSLGVWRQTRLPCSRWFLCLRSEAIMIEPRASLRGVVARGAARRPGRSNSWVGFGL